MIGKKEAEELAEREGKVIFATDAGLDNALYIYVKPYWDGEVEYFEDFREIIFEWYDKKEEKQRVLKITENNIDFLDAPAEVQEAYRRYLKESHQD